MAKRLTDEEIIASLPAARRRAIEADAIEPRAASARYDPETDRVIVELTSGCVFAFPRMEGAGLETGTPEQLSEVEVLPGGEALHWDELDADISLPGLMARLLNLRQWAPRMLGQTTSEAKARAAKANGRKGGRPRKRPAESA